MGQHRGLHSFSIITAAYPLITLFSFIPHLPHPTQAGGSLTMRFVRLNTGKGTIRPRSAMEGAGNNNEQGDSANGTSKGTYGNMVLEFRGGSVLFEPGAEVSNFVGVYFVGEQQSVATMQRSINQSLGRVAIRVYGNRVSAVIWDVGR